MPRLGGHPSLGGEMGEDLSQAFGSMGWKGDRALGGVDFPSQQGFTCVPVSVSLLQLFDGRGLLLGWLGRIGGLQDLIHTVQEHPGNVPSTCLGALD